MPDVQERVDTPLEQAGLTPTSYAILGLLAIKPWTTYELAKQMDRTLNRFWPRAKSKLYEEPKKLVRTGLAVATPGAHGRRPRTVYSITPSGRRALAVWLSTESGGPVFESEHILKVFYAGTEPATTFSDPGSAAGLDFRTDAAQHRGRFGVSAGRRTVPGTTRHSGADRAVPGRLPRDDRPLGPLGHRYRRRMAGRSLPRHARSGGAGHHRSSSDGSGRALEYGCLRILKRQALRESATELRKSASMVPGVYGEGSRWLPGDGLDGAGGL